MTNEELIRRFFIRGLMGGEKSYGFSIKTYVPFSGPCEFVLSSKISQFPIARKISDNYFLVTSTNITITPTLKKHVELVIAIAKQLSIDIVFSPGADKARFQKYMENKINGNLIDLARDLRTGRYKFRAKYVDANKPEREISFGNRHKICYAVPENYQKLMENIQTLLIGEVQLDLPKNQTSLVDHDEFQSMWRWLIKENPVKEDREILTKIYTLSRMFGNRQKEEFQFWSPKPGKQSVIMFLPPLK